MKRFIKKHPWLLRKSVAFTMWICGLLAAWLTKSMLLMLDLKGKDPNPPEPPPPEPPPPSAQLPSRPQLRSPYQPSWVGATFARGGLYKHPVLKARAEFVANQKALEEANKAQLAPTVAATTEVGGEAINSLCEAIARVKEAVDLSQKDSKKKEK